MTSLAAFFQRRFIVRSTLVLIALCTFNGCATDHGTPDLTEAQKQDAIIAHPMEYKPQVQGNSTGGDFSSFDNQSFGRDVHNFLNP